MQIMKKKQLKTYCPPKSILIHIDIPSLMETSFPNSGGHNKAGDDGNGLNAKQGWFDEDYEADAPRQWGI